MTGLFPELAAAWAKGPDRPYPSLWRRMHSTDAAVARDIVSDEITRHSLRLADPSVRFSFQYRTVKIATTTLSDFAYLGSASIIDLPRDERDCYLMIIPVGGYTVASIDGVDSRLEPGSAIVLDPQAKLSFHNAPRWHNLDIRINRRRLEQYLAEELCSRVVRPIHFAKRPISLLGEGGALLRFVKYLLGETLAPQHTSLSCASTAARFEDALYSIILDTVPNEYRELRRSAVLPPAPVTVVNAEHYIMINAREPLCIEEIAQASHVRPRSLHKAFHKYRGYSPLRFLRDYRLDLARQALLQANPRSATVAEIALDCGFSHLGKFAAIYKKRYGETPSTTLRFRKGGQMQHE